PHPRPTLFPYTTLFRSPETIDVEQPSAARIYDYLLGGSHNFAADREFARQAIATMPDVPVQAHANRAFLRRAVQYLVDAGVRQRSEEHTSELQSPCNLV